MLYNIVRAPPFEHRCNRVYLSHKHSITFAPSSCRPCQTLIIPIKRSLNDFQNTGPLKICCRNIMLTTVSFFIYTTHGLETILQKPSHRVGMTYIYYFKIVEAPERCQKNQSVSCVRPFSTASKKLTRLQNSSVCDLDHLLVIDEHGLKHPEPSPFCLRGFIARLIE